MINVIDYIKLVLKKKNWTNQRLCDELNKIESQLGESRTSKQNISNYLNGRWDFRPKVLAKYELALGLPVGTLINMVAPPLTKNGQKELEETIKKVREVKI